MKSNKERVKLIGEKTMKNRINGIKYIIPIPIKIALSFLSILNVICMFIPSMYNGSHFKNPPQPLNFFTYILSERCVLRVRYRTFDNCFNLYFYSLHLAKHSPDCVFMPDCTVYMHPNSLSCKLCRKGILLH